MQENFNLGALDDWMPVGIGEILRFELPSTGIRQADFQVMADRQVSVFAALKDGSCWLVGLGEGLLNIKFSMAEEVFISFEGADMASIWIKTKLGTQALPESGEPTFTDIEPRRMSASEKITRVQQLMSENAQKRVLQLMEGLAAQQAALDAKLAAAGLVEPLDAAPSGGAGDAAL